ncbi:choice-of-anchor F family protein [Roseovarius sp.]|uniref:choice-of-anchor F family protein n=1 Tax=Roseovarius sp. TaxID=1486281 RepID=UPI003566ABFF
MSRNKALLKTGTSILGLSAALAVSAAYAGEIEEFLGWTGAGYVLLDEDENVVAPGIAVYTDDLNNEDFTTANGFSPQGVLNCIRSNQVPLTNPANPGCQQGPATGNRYKLRLDDIGAFDLTFGVAPSGGVTEYFNFGKVTNETGARILSFDMVLGTGTGNSFTVMDPSDPSTAVLFDNLTAVTGDASTQWGDFLGGETTGQNPLQRVFFPGGLFGSGGQEGAIGFFDTERAAFVAIQNADGTIINVSDLTQAGAGTFYQDNFGTALIATNMLPEGIFWDENDDPSDESSLIAWFDHSRDAWVWGNLSIDDGSDGAYSYAQLAAALGVTETELVGAIGSTDREALAGTEIPAGLLAAIQSNPAFEVGAIEDLANLNLNFNIDAGDIPFGNFTLRFVPVFAPIVNVAASDLQFGVAAALDAANVPFLGADAFYAGDPLVLDDGLIGDILALPTVAEQQMALESIGQSFMGAFGGLSYGMGSDALFALRTGGDSDAGMAVSSRGMGRWAMNGTTNGFVSINGSRADYDRTQNGAAYTTDTMGVHGGLEMSFSPEWSGGVMLSGMSGEVDVMADRGSIDADGFGVTGFARYTGQMGGADMNVRVAAGLQSLSYDITRNISFGAIDETATGSTDGTTLYAGVSADWMVASAGAFNYGPMASLEYYNVSIDGYQETGAGLFNLDVGEMDTDMFLARVGAQGRYASGNFEMGGHLALTGRSGGGGEVISSFTGSALPGMASPLEGMSDVWLDLGTSVAMTLGDGNSSIGVQYGGALFADGFEEHRIGAFFEMRF